MRQTFGIGLVFVAFLGIPPARPAEPQSGKPIVVVVNGKSDYAIVVPDEDPIGAVTRASALLQTMLGDATGAKLPIVKESAHKEGTPAIFLGATRTAEKAGLPLKELKSWAFLKAVKGKDIFLAGHDALPGNKDPYAAFLGTKKAVISFLEDEVGVRFLLPGPNGRYVPRIESLAVPADLRVTWKPVFEYSIGRFSGDLDYDIANNCLPTGVFKSWGGHSHNEAVPAEKYAKTHPEYFALIGGVRNSSENHLCISNPAVQELMLKLMEQVFDEGYEWVELCQTDGYVPCECEKCGAIHPDPSERLWIVHAKLAAEMEKRRPGKKVVINAYGPTTDPPRTIKRFPENVIIQAMDYSDDALRRWKALGVRGIVVYVYNWGPWPAPGLGPKRTPRFAAEQTQVFADNKVRGIYKCGAFEAPGLEGPAYYVYGRMMNDPAQDYRPILGDFYRAAYGKACAPMKAFFEGMFERLELFCVFDRPNLRGLPDYVPLRLALSPEAFYTTVFTPSLLASMEKNLNRAKELAVGDDPHVRARVRLVEFEFNWVKNIASVFHLFHAYRAKPCWGTFNLLAEAIDGRKALIASLVDEKGRFKLFDGWPMVLGNANRQVLQENGLARPSQFQGF